MKLLEARPETERPPEPPRHPRARPRLPDYLWVPAIAALVVLPIGLLGWAAEAMWLFPSLGPTVALQVLTPHRESAKPYHVIAGHMTGMAAGFLGVVLTGALNAPPVIGAQPLLLPHVWASTVAMALTVIFQHLLRAEHAPGFATALLITTGALPTGTVTAAAVIFGVVLVIVLGEPARWAALSRASRRVAEAPARERPQNVRRP